MKISGSDNVRVEGVFVEGHANSLTLDYSQYTNENHKSITITDFIGVNPMMNTEWLELGGIELTARPISGHFDL